MQRLTTYLKLMRLDKPIGILLLLWPTFWALWIASDFHPPLFLVGLFSLGVVVMRSAGCIINDIADRHIDKHVERTALRPLTCGQLSLIEAIGLLIMLLMIALLIVLQLNQACFYWALIGVVITFIYPFCKRFLKAPQLVLGFAFSWGVPMAFIAVLNHINSITWLVMLITYCWILIYDTMYAMADRQDDIRIGVNSTAILFGSFDKAIIFSLQCIVQLLWLLLIKLLNLSSLSIVFWMLGWGLVFYQQYLIKDRIANKCFSAFLNNHWYGMLYWLGFVVMHLTH
jgi:4-hydroxybenzoate polyprenyltransferase